MLSFGETLTWKDSFSATAKKKEKEKKKRCFPLVKHWLGEILFQLWQCHHIWLRIYQTASFKNSLCFKFYITTVTQDCFLKPDEIEIVCIPIKVKNNALNFQDIYSQGKLFWILFTLSIIILLWLYDFPESSKGLLVASGIFSRESVKMYWTDNCPALVEARGRLSINC